MEHGKSENLRSNIDLQEKLIVGCLSLAYPVVSLVADISMVRRL